MTAKAFCDKGRQEAQRSCRRPDWKAPELAGAIPEALRSQFVPAVYSALYEVCAANFVDVGMAIYWHKDFRGIMGRKIADVYIQAAGVSRRWCRLP